MDTALTANPDAYLLGPFTSTDANVEPLHVNKTIYLPTSFVRLFFEWDLATMEA